VIEGERGKRGETDRFFAWESFARGDLFYIFSLEASWFKLMFN